MLSDNFYRPERLSERLWAIWSRTGEVMCTDAAVLVDTCVGVGNLRAVVEGITSLPVTVLITHGHVDHAMGAALFDTVYMNRNLAGLRAAAPGFCRVQFEPVIERRLGRLRASYQSVSGTWESSWTILESGELRVALTVPYGCTACVRLPHHPTEALLEVGTGAHEWTYTPTADLLARYDEGTLFKDMLADPEAMDAIREELGLLSFYLDIGAEDYLYETLSTISHMEYLGFRPEKVRKLGERLRSLRIC